jgi:hypothetical protein
MGFICFQNGQARSDIEFLGLPACEAAATKPHGLITKTINRCA